MSSISISTYSGEAFFSRWPWSLSLSLPLPLCPHIQFPQDICKNSGLHRVAYSIPKGYVYRFCILFFFGWYGIYAYIFSSWRICAQVIYSFLLAGIGSVHVYSIPRGYMHKWPWCSDLQGSPW